MDLQRFVPDFQNSPNEDAPFREWGTRVVQTCLIPSSFVEMCWTDILEMCKSSAGFWMDGWQSYSITTDTVLMLISITIVLSLPPKYSISADSLS